MKDKIISSLFMIFTAFIASGIVILIAENSIFQVKNDEIELKNEQIKNLKVQVKNLEKLNSIYKKDNLDNPKESVKSNSSGVTMDGKSISLSELIIYTNKVVNERDNYKAKYDLISDYYGLYVYEKDGYFRADEKRNGKVFMLNKEIYVQKSIIEQFQKQYKKRIEYNINDSIVTFKEYPIDK